MIVKPRIRGFICTTAHPHGCAAHVNQQIDYVAANSGVADGAFGNVFGSWLLWRLWFGQPHRGRFRVWGKNAWRFL